MAILLVTQHHAFASLLPHQECLATYEPRLEGFYIGTKTCFGDAKAQVAAHFVAIERQAGFSAQRVAGAQAAGFQPERRPFLHESGPQGWGLVGMDEQLKRHPFTRIACS